MRGIVLLAVAALGLASVARAGQPLRLADGRPFVCVYFFGHWWEPWRSNDEVILRDMKALADMGVSVLAVDHEWSQAIDGNWKWLDREHRLAKRAGLQILPWLSLKVFSDLSSDARRKLAKQWYGVDIKLSRKQDGSPGSVLIWDGATLRFGAAYAADYLERYADGALLHVRWRDGRVRSVVALSVELGWPDGGFDDATNLLFIRWVRNKYGTIGALNRAWGTNYASFWDVDPCDTKIFDFEAHNQGRANYPQAVEDHVEFRAELISDSLGMMATLLRRKHPEVLILAELPYQFGSRHPHARAYRINYAANPSCARSADILFFRCTGILNPAEAKTLSDWVAETRQPAILAYRTYSDWAAPRTPEQIRQSAELYARQAAELANGFGFYSWNEMVDTHVAPSQPEDLGKPGALTAEQARHAIALVREMVRRYLELVGQGPPVHLPGG